MIIVQESLKSDIKLFKNTCVVNTAKYTGKTPKVSCLKMTPWAAGFEEIEWRLKFGD